MSKLRLSPDLALPEEAITQTFGVLGMRGSGKSNVAVVMAEAMYRAGLHWVAIDPKGDWWGIRSATDGKSPGLPVVILGGRHGDVPLEPTSGIMLADLIIEHTLTCVLDLSEFSEGDKIRFLAGVGREEGFAGRLYRRKSEEQPPTHLFFEEAHDYIPQQVMRDKAKLLHDCSKLLLWGRARGIGGTAISQRSARIHKDVLTQIDTLIVLRVTAPQDRDAIAAWVKYHGQSHDLLMSLAGLKNGEGWVWSPEWLNTLKQVQFLRRSTFDSGATPEVGKKGARPATLADVDLGALRERMAATIERAKATDPRELQREVARLKAELARKPQAVVAVPAVKEIRVEVPILKDGQIARLEKVVGTWDQATTRLVSVGQVMSQEAKALTAALVAAKNGARPPAAPLVRPFPAMAPRLVPSPRPASGGLTLGERKILKAIAQYPGGASREQLTVLTGYKRSSRDTYLQRVQQRGLIAAHGGRIIATPAGVEALAGDFEPLPTGAALREHWLGRLPEGERRILAIVANAFPHGVERERISDLTGYKRSSRDTYLQRLAARQLVVNEGRGAVRATEELF
jgi:hypothetical protein